MYGKKRTGGHIVGVRYEGASRNGRRQEVIKEWAYSF